MTKRLQGQILEQLNGLPADQQKRVLDFARALALSAPVGVPGRELVRFGGVIPREALEQISSAIEEGCERIDADGW
jgi:hypothetical protein